MADLNQFIDESIRYTFDDILGKSSVLPEHREEVKNIIMSHVAPHVRSVPEWMFNYLAHVNDSIVGNEGYTWLDHLVGEALFMSGQPITIDNNYIAYIDTIMTHEEYQDLYRQEVAFEEQVKQASYKEDDIIKFVKDSKDDIWTIDVSEKFGTDEESKQVYLSLCWKMISEGKLKLGDRMQLHV